MMPLWRPAVDAGSLEAIAAADYAIPAGIAPAEVLSDLVGHLGSPRSDVRELSFAVLGEWIGRGVYAEGELTELIGVLTGALKVGIGEQGTDTVFARSFSALVLGKIVDRDTTAPFLVAEDVRDILDAAMAYVTNERDLRAFTPDKGWIHTAAHAGDLLAALARNPHLGERELELLLGGIAAKMRARVAHVYLRFEDERLSQAVVSVMRRGVVSDEAWADWIDQLGQPVAAPSWMELLEGSEAEVSAWHNTRDFLRTVYFQLRLGREPVPGATGLLPRLEDALRSMDPGFYDVADPGLV